MANVLNLAEDDDSYLHSTSCRILKNMSNLFRERRSTASETEQQLIDGARVVLEIAKGSADAYPSLKSRLGDIDALIKNYDVRPYRIVSRLC